MHPSTALFAGFSRKQALSASSSSPWTRDLRHVTAVIPRFWTKKNVWGDRYVKAVKNSERIKWWNIVPGDRVRVLGDPESTIHEVSQINRLTNRVYLKRRTTSEDTGRPPADKNVHYARCQLYLRHQQFPPSLGELEPQNLPVFATRLSTTEPKWAPPLRRFYWNRYAVATYPRLPEWSKDYRPRIHVPWPEVPRREVADATSYDTELSAVTEITYVPPPLPSDVLAPAPEAPSEQEYIRSLTKRAEVSGSLPLEVHIHRELANPHSRAKKQERWQAYQLYKRSLLQQMIQAEYKNLQGRTRRDAKAEATFKWRQRLEDERKAEVKRRWRNRGQEAKLDGKRERKARKAERMDRKLRDLVLQAAPNQVIPSSRANV